MGMLMGHRKKATSFIRVNAESLSYGPASPTLPLSPRTNAAGDAAAEPAPEAQQAAPGVISPVTPIKAPPNGASQTVSVPCLHPGTACAHLSLLLALAQPTQSLSLRHQHAINILYVSVANLYN